MLSFISPIHCSQLTSTFNIIKGFLGVLVTRPNDIAALDFPDSLANLCADRPSAESVNTTEPGRKKRDFTPLDESKRGWELTKSVMRNAKHRRNRLHVWCLNGLYGLHLHFIFSPASFCTANYGAYLRFLGHDSFPSTEQASFWWNDRILVLLVLFSCRYTPVHQYGDFEMPVY